MITLQLTEKKLQLFFPFQEDLLIKARAIPTGRWNKSLRCWEYAINCATYVNIKKEFGASHLEMEKLLEKKKIDISKYKPKVPLYQHQKEAKILSTEDFHKDS